MDKPRRNFWQLWNMSIGFAGIQFGWSLQMANMSPIYEYLGAKPSQLAYLWLAAPLTGLIVQPLIGNASDHTWGPLGRRRPYFLAGAILSSLALILMPRSSVLWMAAGLLWILDASINVSMEPFRAFVADILPEEQRTRGFAMQSLMIGIGSVLAFCLPWILHNWVHLPADTSYHAIPRTVRVAFYVGSVAFFGAVLWTILTTHEYPPEDLAEFRRSKLQRKSLGTRLSEIASAIAEMPRTMRQLAPVQFLTWMGLFCMFLYFSVAVAHYVFGATDPKLQRYTDGIEWAGVCSAFYSGVCFVFSFFLPSLAGKLGRKHTHSLCLTCGALGLMSVAIIHQPYLLLLSMIGVGMAWASILSMPYSILAASLPNERVGVYMGIFNFFIVTPEIIASACFGKVMTYWLHDNTLYAVIAGGVFLILAAILMQRVADPTEERGPSEPKLETASVRAGH
jgi:maltose/moltooligosaccharide transporter